EEALLMADLIDPPAKAPEVWRGLLEGEGQAVGVARVGASSAPGQAVEARVEPAAHQVGQGRRGGGALGDDGAAPLLEIGRVAAQASQRWRNLGRVVLGAEPGVADVIAQ